MLWTKNAKQESKWWRQQSKKKRPKNEFISFRENNNKIYEKNDCNVIVSLTESEQRAHHYSHQRQTARNERAKQWKFIEFHDEFINSLTLYCYLSSVGSWSGCLLFIRFFKKFFFLWTDCIAHFFVYRSSFFIARWMSRSSPRLWTLKCDHVA